MRTKIKLIEELSKKEAYDIYGGNKKEWKYINGVWQLIITLKS